MPRTTIDYGIDLGTTNSAIALLIGTEVEVIRNNEGWEYTPSAVFIDKNDRLYVGRRAREHLEIDQENATSEFKLQMGTDAEVEFARSGRQMKPEELSAEVLKSLKGDVLQRRSEEVRAAAITVPAAFDLPQCEATNRAAEMAGFVLSPLLQEPVAAGLAHGFQTESERVFWLVYDLGGGTFDAAAIQVRDGVIQVVNHGGDNHLGGKLIDWEIVDQLLVPAVTSEYSLDDFRRGNPTWATAFAKLKIAAEEAKIRLSRDASTEIIIDFLCLDGKNEPVRFEHEVSRAEVEQIAHPFIVRSINIAKKVLTEKRLGAADIEKVLLVGGPSLMTYLRDQLADPNEGLGIPLDFTMDPLTVVARGAAIFAGTQRLVEDIGAVVAEGKYGLELDYKPVGADVEPLVGGKAIAPSDETLVGLTVEFINEAAQPAWRSGKVGLAPNGTFMTSLWAEKGQPSTFRIELCDASGNVLPCKPDTLTYTPGIVITDPPLIHSLGVALASGEMQVFLEKGVPLPARRRSVHRTTVEVVKGQSEAVIRIPVVEGENRSRVDRNQLIGELVISAEQIKRNIPAGSEVEVTIEVDASRLLRTKAYIPVLDDEYEDVIRLEKVAADPEKLRREVDREKARLEEMRTQAEATDDPGAQSALRRIDQERMLHDVETALDAAQDDRDAADKCQKRLLDLKQAGDEVEDSLEWPALVAEANETIEMTRSVVQEHGDSSDKQRAATLERETRSAEESRDPYLLRRKISELDTLRMQIIRQQPGFHVGLLQWLEERKANMRDQPLAEQLFAQGNRAIQNNDVPALQAANQQLIALLRSEDQEEMSNAFGSTIM